MCLSHLQPTWDPTLPHHFWLNVPDTANSWCRVLCSVTKLLIIRLDGNLGMLVLRPVAKGARTTTLRCVSVYLCVAIFVFFTWSLIIWACSDCSPSTPQKSKLGLHGGKSLLTGLMLCSPTTDICNLVWTIQYDILRNTLLIVLKLILHFQVYLVHTVVSIQTKIGAQGSVFVSISC